MNKKNIDINKLYIEVKDLLNKKYENIKNNYFELYKNYSQKELIRDNYLKKIEKDLNNLKNMYGNKDDNIYILFEYYSALNYNMDKLKKLGKLEITKNNYYYFMEILPPLKYTNKGFIMSEFLSGNYTDYYYEENNKYYIELIEVDKFQLEKEFYGDY